MLKSQQKLPLSHTKTAPVRSHPLTTAGGGETSQNLDLNRKHLRETRETGQVDEYCLPLLAEFLSIHPFGATSESIVFPKKKHKHILHVRSRSNRPLMVPLVPRAQSPSTESPSPDEVAPKDVQNLTLTTKKQKNRKKNNQIIPL